MNRRLMSGLAAFAAVMVAVSASACGGDASAGVLLKKVPVDMVPAELPGTAGDPPLTLAEYAQGARRIDAAGKNSMVVDGKVWEIRRGTTLVGALQVSTLLPKVDLSKPKQREQLASLVLSGAVQRIQVQGVEVVASRTADKVVFLWFGNQLFEVLQMKGAGISPENMLKGILDYQRPTGQLRIVSKGHS